MDNDIIRELAALDNMPFKELKQRWHDAFGAEPPGYNRIFLTKRLSYHIQEQAYGGISEPTRAKLSRLLKTEGYDEIGRPTATPGTLLPETMVAGTVLVRHFNEKRYTVTVLEDGYEFEGRPYRSLSAIARRITGTNWNGPAFFGLRKKGKATVRGGGSHGQ
jgi:hypothetical protein